MQVSGSVLARRGRDRGRGPGARRARCRPRRALRDGAGALVFGTGRAAAGPYWTPERIAAAPGLGIDAGGRVRTARPGPAAITAGALRSVRVRNPARYPNRVHGKLPGTFRGLGDFACSATVVSSRSGSLLIPPGHCAFDAGGTGRFATNLAFVPGYSRGEHPYGVWSVGHVIVPGAWARFGLPDFDIAMLRVRRRQAGTLESVVGARGIGFGQSRKQRLQAYGFPGRACSGPAYDGTRLIRCDSRQSADPGRFGGPRGRGIRCDMGRGASGGGWVAQRAIVVSNTSHAYSRRARGRDLRALLRQGDQAPLPGEAGGDGPRSARSAARAASRRSSAPIGPSASAAPADATSSPLSAVTTSSVAARGRT